MKKFELTHVTLYSKGWYKRSKDIWLDMKKCLSADGYLGEYMTNNDCIRIIVNEFDKMPRTNQNSLLSVLSGISKENCWRYGYYTKDSCHFGFKKSDDLPEYDQGEATLRFILSHISQFNNKQWEVEKPNYEKCLPRKNGITKSKLRSFETHTGDTNKKQ